MKKFILILVSLFCFTVVAQEVQPQKEMTFEDYYIQAKESTAKIQTYVEELENKTTLQEADIEKLQSNVKNLVGQVDEKVEQISEQGTKILQLYEKVKLQRKWLLILSSILGVLFVGHIILLLLKAKWNITIPYWLNTIL